MTGASPSAFPHYLAASAAGSATMYKSVDPNRRIKQGIWLYFLLLIFEGGLRKWILPGLATPLLIVRDPIAIWLVYATWRKGLLPANIYQTVVIIVAIAATFTTLLVGHGNLTVTLYGARILLFHFPVMFVIGRIFTRADVVKMGKALIWISIPMAILITLQFYSPQSALVNRGVGGDMAGGGFDGAMGFFRPPGTFSFTNGTHLFFGFVACFVCYFWVKSENINKLALIAATVGLLAAIPFSISRSLLLYVAVAFFFGALGMVRRPEYIGRVIAMVLLGVVLAAVLSQLSFLQTPIKAFTSRFENASDAEGGLQGSLGTRYLGGMVEAVTGSSKQPFFGYGLGMGTNAGTKLLTGDTDGYLISEGEWGRLIGEMGPLMGLAIIFVRLSLCFKIGVAAYRRLVQNDLLPWILLGYVLLTIPQAQWAQPTTLGFSTLIGGLILASLRPGAPLAPVPPRSVPTLQAAH